MGPWLSLVLMHTNEALCPELHPELRPQRAQGMGGNMLTDDDPHSWSQQRRKRLARLRPSNTALLLLGLYPLEMRGVPIQEKEQGRADKVFN